MPVYEIVMQHPTGRQRGRHGEHVSAEIGDVLTLDGNSWIVIAKEPPFEQRRIERLVCAPRTVLHYRRRSP
jgi:hypothetical protein